jgi:hypothetical protein
MCAGKLQSKLAIVVESSAHYMCAHSSFIRDRKHGKQHHIIMAALVKLPRGQIKSVIASAHMQPSLYLKT